MENKKEIIVKGIKVEDTKWGPRIGVVDMEGKWYNSAKSKVKDANAWEILCGLKAGDHLDLAWTVREYDKKDGTKGYANDITWFDKVIRADPPAQASPQGDPAPVQTRDDLIAKESAYKSAAELLKSIPAKTVEEAMSVMTEGVPGIDEHINVYKAVAHALYADMKTAW